MKFDDIPGWFNPIDQAAFTWILKYQNRVEPVGGLVELGVFKGKSAVLMGNFLRPGEVFTVCDLFEDVETSESADAHEQKFFRTQSLTQSEFERNYLAFHKDLPRVVRGPTDTITRHVAPGTARFVHIDAGHTYKLVREDTASARMMLRKDGVVVFDDYRKPSAQGNMAAVWEAVANEGLKPFANTDFKLYATWGDPDPLRAEIVARAAESGWSRTAEPSLVRDLPVVYLSRKG
ncbi:MAG: class I SAM-dependent methyltransferase [Rhodobacter sp.]|uniref:class I SAM-dependent methyltransferase n=1 Tax=Pararhodobacter sp. TaxID=2127056 RepID=UPI001E117716|nr:class I SAM-dependent methyltransferase [Pararhodobacter sp.]MCB1343816.1 class I SAM-dependent methyltransferase [Paracoccaceae bacterium]MCC0073996.1 class I SAM-dependent methyltransferase [Rhodobacter sp.]HPD93080.1 class I SAM-dependent methyltransferase [Pararhodobacter sp.]